VSIRGNKRPNVVAKAIFALIVVLVIAVTWFGIQGMRKEPQSPPRGSQALPGAAAERQIAPAGPS
jgi:hypothetical protein